MGQGRMILGEGGLALCKTVDGFLKAVTGGLLSIVFQHGSRSDQIF